VRRALKRLVAFLGLRAICRPAPRRDPDAPAPRTPQGRSREGGRMTAVERKSSSRWSTLLAGAVSLVSLNVFSTLAGHQRVRNYFDAFFVALIVSAFLATRPWPDNLRFRRPREW